MISITCNWFETAVVIIFTFKCHKNLIITIYLFIYLFTSNTVVNVTSQLGKLKIVSPSLQSKFASSSLKEAELASLMEKYIR